MDKPLIESLAARVDHLEQQNRRLKRIVTAALIGAILLMTGAARFADQSRVIEAERFVLRDKNGKIRAELAVTGEDAAGLVLFDQDEKQRMGMVIYANRLASFKMFGDDEKNRTTMFVMRDGTSGINFFHDEKIKLLIGTDAAGAGYLTIKDRDAKTILEAPLP